MNDYRFFMNAELRFILRGWAGVSQRTIDDIAAFCERKGISTTRWSISPDLWEIYSTRLTVKQEGDTISLHKQEYARRNDFLGHLFVLIVLALFLAGGIYGIVSTGFNTKESILMALVCLILPFATYEVYQRSQKTAAENKFKKELKITSGNLSFFREDQEVLSGAVEGINLYWGPGFDAGDDPDLTLDVVLAGKKVVRIDQDGDHRELFLLADTLQTQTGVGMNVMRKNPPEIYTQAL